MGSFIGNTTAYMASMVGGLYQGIQDEQKTDLHTGRQAWDYQQRSTQSVTDKNSFFSLWTTSRYGNMDPDLSGLEGNCMLGLDWSSAQPGNAYSFEWTNLGDSGTWRPYYVKGQVIDSGSSPVIGANVTLYAVGMGSNPGNTPGPGQQVDLWVCEVSTNSGGYYSLPTQFYTAQHYVVATYGSTVGTSVQTITPAA